MKPTNFDFQSLDFYQQYARHYSKLAFKDLESGYWKSSHPALEGDMDLLNRLKELVLGRRGLYAGCGSGARDTYLLWCEGYDMQRVDAVEENIKVAAELHPEIADRIQVADLQRPLSFADEYFDFVICTSVIQHIPPDVVTKVTLKELVRVLRPGGILQLLFKNGQGVETVHDQEYGVDRTFQLYDEYYLLKFLEGYGCQLVEAESEDALGGFMYLIDPKPMSHCVFFAAKTKIL